MLNNYTKLDSGAIKQINVAPYKYDEKYVTDRYDKYGIQCDMMSYLRYGFIVGSIRHKPESILDVGYGNGSFLKICQSDGIEAFGTDVSCYELKYGTPLKFDECFGKRFDVVTFFDSLEHFENIDFLKNIECGYVCISVPNCSYDEVEEKEGEKNADIYFRNWKHRRENEHIWHFDIKSLEKTMNDYGYTLINYENIEDTIRKSVDKFQNIITAIFKKI